jgi:hypothetical protein
MTATALLPLESMALFVARKQLERGENPEINTTAMLVWIIDRLVDEAGEQP